MRAVLIWRDIGNYHAARSQAVGRLSSLAVTTIEVQGQALFADFRASDHLRGTFSLRGLGLSESVSYRTVSRVLSTALNDIAPDVVYVPGWSMVEALVALEWCARAGKAAVIMSDSQQGDEPRTPYKEFLKRRVIRTAHSLFVAGTRHADYASVLGCPTDRTFVGYDVVDNEHFARTSRDARANRDDIRKRLGLPERYILCCARLVEEKNHRRLLLAYERALSTGEIPSDVRLVLAGPGDLEPAIRSQASELLIEDKIIFSGAVAYGDVPCFYALADAAILPSTTEQWGLVVNEAMASGTPVLVSKRCGCAPDLVRQGENGFLFDPLDVQAMADAMARVTSPDCDRAAMGRAGQAIIADWGLERFVEGFEAAARAALAAPRRRVSLADRALLRVLAQR